MFPKLYGPNQSNVELKIDNELMTTSNNMVNVTNTAVNILFQCTRTTPTPCLLEITNSQNHQTLAKSDGLISICFNVREVLNLTFTFVFCHSRNQKNTFYYIFTPTYTNETQLLKEAGGKNYLNELFTSLTIYVGIFLSGVFVGKWPLHLLYNRYLRCRLQNLLRMVVGVLPWKPRICYSTATVTEDKYAEIMTSLQYEHSLPQECYSQGSCIENRITVSCPKENKHDQFIGLGDLGTKRENEYMRKKDEDVDRIIISVYHLTVQLVVKKCCSSRKKVWPDTQVPYPLASSETPTATMRTGTGRVWRVTKYTNGVDECGGEHREHKTCPCAQCEKSGTPKSVWAKISVSTSKALVYDGFEAEDVQCRLFYDNLNPAELLEGFRVENDNIATDFCSLTCYTCNIALIEKLKEHLEEFNETNNKIQSLQTTLTRLNGFVFIVSHPHGEEKKISFGKIVHKNEIVGVGTRLVYTAPTCPGSSGAPVIAPAHCSSWSYHTQVVHCGQIDSQHNCSGFFSTPVTL
uniref:Uncharacterized protein n=1 Tax=Biomphalaria glabrata TaxID=6526 RepID=A0A2C9LGL0_BIOGL